MRLVLDSRQREPEPENGCQDGQDDRLQHLHALCLRDGTDGEGENGSAASAERGGEADGADVQVFREDFRRGDLRRCTHRQHDLLIAV